MDLAITPDNRWECATTDLVSAASTAGFSAVGIHADRADAAASGAYAATGIRCHEVLALVISDDEPMTMAAAEQMAHTAEVMRAPWVLTVFTTPLKAGTVLRCAKMFEEAGSRMAVEFSPLGPISSIGDGMEVVRAVNRGGGHAGLMIDSCHFCFGDSTWADLAEVPLDDIAYVQFTDALKPESPRLVRETLHRRALPGEGVLELDRFAATLLDRGWDGIVSVEVLNAEFRTLPIDELTRRLHDTTAPYWR